MTPTDRPLPRLAVLFSGGGRTLENLARQIAQGSLRAAIPLAVSSHAGAGGIARAAAAGIPCEVVDFREHGSGLSARVLELVEAARADWIILAGFIRHLELPERWQWRVPTSIPPSFPRSAARASTASASTGP
jgi:folate-dependent phosphoribosylglycinamide formyltransferase PurN